ncbi:sensor histidine kinase [Bailinhaonella thermotolerans]|uniref:sensor histidine kinase n=1 Tax=Bailinhaonella thermotolerans TaxID=1070861 RepID=UPI00192A468B|nr:HAMP domain-containing sensor histidine kinase [Bailinhaonella thermotolerans]
MITRTIPVLSKRQARAFTKLTLVMAAAFVALCGALAATSGAPWEADPLMAGIAGLGLAFQAVALMLKREAGTGLELSFVIALYNCVGVLAVPGSTFVALSVIVMAVVRARRPFEWRQYLCNLSVNGIAVGVFALAATAAGLPHASLGPLQVAVVACTGLGFPIVHGLLAEPAVRILQDTPARPLKSHLLPLRLPEVGLNSAGMAILIALGSRLQQPAWVVLAVLPAVIVGLRTRAAYVHSDMIQRAEQLLGVPDKLAAKVRTPDDLAAICAELRRIMGAKELWFHTALPHGQVWVHTSEQAGNAAYISSPRHYPGWMRSSSPEPQRIPAALLPGGWGHGIQAEVVSPDGRMAGHLICGWDTTEQGWITRALAIGPISMSSFKAMSGALGHLIAEIRSGYLQREEISRLNSVVQHASVAIAAADAAGRVVVWNQAMAAMSGVPAGHALGRREDEVLRLETADGSPVSLRQGAQGSLRLRSTATGQPRWVQAAATTPQEAALTGVHGMVLVDEDDARKIEMMRATLLQAVQHELRTPLTPIRGYAQLLMADGPMPDAQRREWGRHIYDATLTLDRTLSDLATVTSLTDPDGPLLHARLEPLVVDEIVASAVAAVPQARVTVQQLTPGIKAVGDPVRFRQCLIALLVNATRYAPGAPVDIVVAQSGAWASVMVVDQGPGIDPRDRPHIFERRYRGRTASAPGSGMGLYITRTLMTAMNGSIELLAGYPGGACFELKLPLMQR